MRAYLLIYVFPTELHLCANIGFFSSLSFWRGGTGAAVKQYNTSECRNPDDTFAAVYQEWYDPIFHYIHAHISQYETAQDLTQNVFTAAWKHWNNYDPATGSLRAWLYCIARNLLKNHYRDKKPVISLEELQVSGVPEPASDAFRQAVQLMESRSALNRALQSLSECPRQVVVLKYFAGKSNQEIADLLGLTNGNVRVILTRSLQKIYKFLLQDGFLPEE